VISSPVWPAHPWNTLYNILYLLNILNSKIINFLYMRRICRNWARLQAGRGHKVKLKVLTPLNFLAPPSFSVTLPSCYPLGTPGQLLESRQVSERKNYLRSIGLCHQTNQVQLQSKSEGRSGAVHWKGLPFRASQRRVPADSEHQGSFTQARCEAPQAQTCSSLRWGKWSHRAATPL